MRINNKEVSVYCAHCGQNFTVSSNCDHNDEVVIYVEPHLCNMYVDDRGMVIDRVKKQNEALQKRNTELVEENRKLKAGVVPSAT